jgi:DNA invertase Pin-like site-specific DNA recombinase
LHTYARSSTNKQDLNNQKVEILEYARQKGFTIDEFIQITISSRKRTKQRRIDELLAKLADQTLSLTLSL